MLLFFVAFETLQENLKLIDKHVYLFISDFLEESQRQLQIRVFESFIFLPKFCFLVLSLEHFSQSNFKFFHHHPTTLADIFTQTTPILHHHHKKASYGTELYVRTSQLLQPSQQPLTVSSYLGSYHLAVLPSIAT